MEHPAGVRGTVRIEQPRVPVGKPERKAEEIQPVLLGRKRGFLTDAFPDQIAARHEHPGGDFRAGEVTGAAAEQGFTVHTEKGCAFGAEDLTQAGRELVAIFFKSFPFMDGADFAAADIEGRFFLLRRRPRGTFPAQPDTAEEHEGGFLGGRSVNPYSMGMLASLRISRLLSSRSSASCGDFLRRRIAFSRSACPLIMGLGLISASRNRVSRSMPGRGGKPCSA